MSRVSLYHWSIAARAIGAVGASLTRLAVRLDRRARDRAMEGAARKLGMPRGDELTGQERLPHGIDWDAVRRQFDERGQRTGS